MSKNWQKVYSSEDEHRTQIVLHILEEKGFNPVLVKTKDTSINNFGFYNILVAPDVVLEAIKTIGDEIDFK